MGEACPKAQKGSLPASARQQAREAMGRWLDSLGPLLQQGQPPSLMGLSEHVLQTRRQLLGDSLQAVVEHILEDCCGLSQADCPSCGRRLFRKRFEPKQLSTQHGSFVVKRPYFYCGDCREGHLPLDEAIEMAREAHQPEHAWKVARAQYDEHEKAQQWAEATLARLSLDKASDVIGGLKRMLPKDCAAQEEIQKLIRYIENNRHRLGYEARCQEGLPIGSGGIESANKMILHTRLKRSGAWWLETNGNTMLRLRCAIYNGAFDRVLKIM